MKLRTTTHKPIETKDANGTPNGWLLPIYSAVEDTFPEPRQVYLTTVLPKMTKGPHLHHIRSGLFCCIRGDIRLIVKSPEGAYSYWYSGESVGYKTVHVPSGTPTMIQNIGVGEAWVLNMPNPGWTPDMNDEHTADFSDCPVL